MSIARRRSDWPQYLLCQLHAYKTLPSTWPDIQRRKLNNCKFKKGDRVELLDGLVSMRVRPALIEAVIGGRVLVKVSAKDMNKSDLHGQDDEEEDNQIEEGVWMDQCSPLLFYVGWAYKVGYQLLANDEYKRHASEIASALQAGSSRIPYAKNDTRPEQFQDYIDCCKLKGEEKTFVEWEKGMKLEILDPLDTWKELRVATVLEVLADGYLKLGFDGEEMEEDCLPIHSASPLLFPVGYCEKYDLRIKGPQGEGKFDWKSHLKQSKAVAAPEILFEDDPPPGAVEKFKIGAKLEAVDMCEPHLICAATVAAHKGRLLQIKYDGWDDSYDQLFDYRSNNIFPIGWCEMNGYKLEAPKMETKKKAKSKK
uniref:SAM domain-containing protein n=2 Tax=Ascaris TaxID=6251 RepID=A0A0M3I389_ASCLU